MKINWFSNAPWAATGYGNQTKLFYNRIKEMGHEVSITAFWGLQGGIIDVGGVTVFPMVREPYAMDVIGAHAQAWGADAIITLFDAWAVIPENIPSTIGWYPWFPIDTEPVHDLIVARVKKARKGITMSKFGQKEMAKLGIDTYYVPHGVDTKAFHPIDMAQARQMAHLPAGRFIVGMVAANKGTNPMRKAFVEQIAAFSVLKKQHPDALLYIHTEDGSRGGGDCANLVRIAHKMGLKAAYLNPGGIAADVDVVFPDQYQYIIGYPDDIMNATYNSFDVLLMVSMGEGFGIPLIEAQAAGCPVITGEWTSMGELCFSGWKIKREEAKPFWVEGFASWMFSPQIGAIIDRLEAAYEVRGNQDYRTRARDGAKAYDVDKVMEKYWRPVLEDIERSIKGAETELELVKF
jgi:glycosyltransferase involved in cell wall biosynthesis